MTSDCQARRWMANTAHTRTPSMMNEADDRRPASRRTVRMTDDGQDGEREERRARRMVNPTDDRRRARGTAGGEQVDDEHGGIVSTTNKYDDWGPASMTDGKDDGQRGRSTARTTDSEHNRQREQPTARTTDSEGEVSTDGRRAPTTARMASRTDGEQDDGNRARQQRVSEDERLLVLPLPFCLPFYVFSIFNVVVVQFNEINGVYQVKPTKNEEKQRKTRVDACTT